MCSLVCVCMCSLECGQNHWLTGKDCSSPPKSQVRCVLYWFNGVHNSGTTSGNDQGKDGWHLKKSFRMPGFFFAHRETPWGLNYFRQIIPGPLVSLFVHTGFVFVFRPAGSCCQYFLHSGQRIQTQQTCVFWHLALSSTWAVITITVSSIV